MTTNFNYYSSCWIGRRSCTNWSARSPNLIPLDTFLCWYWMKHQLNEGDPNKTREICEYMTTTFNYYPYSWIGCRGRMDSTAQ